MASALASGPAPVTPQSVVVLRKPESPPVAGEKVDSRTGSSLKTLSNDLNELLVRNLSLKRNEAKVPQGQEELVGAAVGGCDVGSDQNNSDSVSLINRNRVLLNNRNSLCDTFSSVNKLIKLKRVSSDLSGYGGKNLGGSDVHSINPPPQAKFKRVEVSVQELPRELRVAPRKSVIVNQFDQLELDEGGDRDPLVIEQASSELPRVEEGIARRIPGIELSDSGVGKVVRRRLHQPAKGGRGATLESVEEEQLRYNRRSLQWPLGRGDWGTEAKIVRQEEDESGEEEEFPGDKGRNRSHFRHSWNAPGYDLLLDEERRSREDSRRDFASIVHNLAGLRSALTNGGTAHLHHHPQNQHESASLLESPHSPQITAGSGGGGPKSTPVVAVPTSGCVVPPSSVVPGEGSHVPVSLGGPVPRKRRLEAFLKSLVGRRPSKEPPPAPPPAPPPLPLQNAVTTPPPLLPSPEIKISRSPSDQNLAEMTRSRLNISTTSLSSVHQRLWSVVPLLKKDVSCTSLAPPKSIPLLGGGSSSSPRIGMRKCETVLALTHSMQTLEQQPIQPKNRLRHCASVATCSRCSSLLSLAAAGSRYSLNLSNGGFVAVPGGTTQTTTTGGTGKHVGSLLRLASTKCSGSGTSSSSSCSANSSPCASSSSSSSLSKSSTSSGSRASVTSKAAMLPSPPAPTIVSAGGNSSPLVAVATLSKFTCKLCLGEYGSENLTRISQCGCSFCTECMTAYVEFEISEGAYEVSCPDAMCPAQGIIAISEITTLASASLVEKHHRYRLNREVELDKFRTWCPKAGCETICLVGQQPQQQPQNSSSSNSSSDRIVQLSPTPVVSSSSLPSPCAVHCPTCREDFCSGCKKAWHPTMSCEVNTRRLAADGQSDGHGIPFDNDLIKCCPMCAVPIEKDEGCAQMMCKRCKHVFCWYCLASLDDDFLLRHYDKGPCKNKLGHSRASVVWHRAQVIGIFAGFGILLLVASPLLLLAAPCIVCCKCRICSGAAKLEETEVDYDDAAVALQPSSLTTPAAATGATSQSGR